MAPRPWHLIDAAWRLGYRAAYRLLRVWWRLRRPQAQGAAVAAWCEGRLLVVVTSYRGLVDLPGGGLARGETALEAAIRELREETKIAAPAAALRPGPRLEGRQEGRHVTDMVFTWAAPACLPPCPDRREIVWAGWLTPAELARRRLTPGLAAYLERRSADHGMAAGQKTMIRVQADKLSP